MFYIFNYEKRFKKLNSSDENLDELKKEYQYISDTLNKLTESGEITSFDRGTIVHLIRNVTEMLAKNYDNVQKGVENIMCAPTCHFLKSSYLSIN